jgi:hypothetical protein
MSHLRVGHLVKVTEGGYGGRKYRIDEVNGTRVRAVHGWWRWKDQPRPADPWHWSGKTQDYDHEFFEPAADLGSPPEEGDLRSQFGWAMDEMAQAWST